VADPRLWVGGLPGLGRTPLRALGTLAEPARAGLRRDVRRSFGIPEQPRPRAADPSRAYQPPDGVARRVHADLPAMVIGGVAALFLQSLHPLAMAGVADHSSYQEDPSGRLRRTAAFMGTTTFGTVEEAEEAIEQVRRVHRRVHGVAPDGRHYSADDPDLVTWIHVAGSWCFLHAVQRYGPERFTSEECDRYYDETAKVAIDLGATWVPRSSDEVTAYLQRLQPELYCGPQARAARDWLLRGVARRPEDRIVYTAIVAAAIGVLPGWARSTLGLPSPPLFDRLVVTPWTRIMCAGLRWAVTPPASSSAPGPKTG